MSSETLIITQDVIKLIQKEGCFDIIYDCLAKKNSTEVSVSFYNVEHEQLTYDLMCYSKHIFIKNIFHKLKRLDTNTLLGNELIEEMLSFHSCFEDHFILDVLDKNNNPVNYTLTEDAKKELIKMSVFLDTYKEVQNNKEECVRQIIKNELKSRSPKFKNVKK